MKGFMKRDFYLMLPNLKFYALFLLLIVGLDFFQVTDNVRSFFGFYVTLFGSSTILGLFSYDDMNRWPAYAAAVSGGRRGQVDGRYGAALLVGGGMAVTLALLDYTTALFYIGVFLVYIDLAIPVGYRFGSRSRTVMIIIIAAMGGLMGAGGATLIISGGGGTFQGHSFGLTAGLPLLAVGLAGAVLSRRVSLGVMNKKEL